MLFVDIVFPHRDKRFDLYDVNIVDNQRVIQSSHPDLIFD
jgi:hypothetical protein